MTTDRSDPVAQLAAQLDALQSRVDRLEAERDILSILHAYGPALDDGNEQAWVDCFTSDGVWETTGPGARRQHRLEGSESLLAFARSHTRAPDHLHKHCVFDSRLDVDVHEANAVSYFARLDALPDGPVVFAFGRYHDRLVRDDSGAWHIAHRRAEIQSTGPRQT